MSRFFVYPGHMAIGRSGDVLSTLLGSCVTVLLYDETVGVGGINHFLLPETPAGEVASGRYGDAAIELLRRELTKVGVDPKRLKAKLYGGGNVIGLESPSSQIGRKNSEFAKECLAQMKIPIVESDLEGTCTRRIKVNCDDFSVEVESLYSSSQGDRSLGISERLAAKRVRVIVVDDSATVRSIFSKVFHKHGLDVVAVASNAYEARDLIVKHRPDVITLDIEMPKINGVAFLEKLMKYIPMPVVMVSSLKADGSAALAALELGALEFFQKPSQSDPKALKDFGASLVEKVRAAASQKICTRESLGIDPNAKVSSRFQELKSFKAVLVGGNTGSREALEEFLGGLAEDTPPVLISNSFVAPFADNFLKIFSLKNPRLRFRVAEEGAFAGPGDVVLCPAGHHLEVVDAAGDQVRLMVKSGRPVSNQLPSADVLFSSAAKALGDRALGIGLSGFGQDGVKGAEKVKACGGQFLCQLPETARSPYLPQALLEAGVVDCSLGPRDLAQMLLQIRGQAAA